MPNLSIDNLNKNFGSEHITFKEGPNGFIYAEINNHSASAKVFIHGAHVTSYIPKGQEPVIFLSSESLFEPGKAIRGGIPISWPWFADHPSDKTKPAHGFARTSEWEVRGSQKLSADETQITLGLRDNERTRELWDYSFDLEVSIHVGDELSHMLTTTNTDVKDFVITQAFHSYYHVGDINEVSIMGLEDTDYIDKVDNFKTKKQDGAVTITDETDRIYLNTTNDCVINDRRSGRNIRISKRGSNSTVVWNPWREKARAMKDLGDDDYTNFVCVETTNAGADLIAISPGEKHTLGLNISSEDRNT